MPKSTNKLKKMIKKLKKCLTPMMLKSILLARKKNHLDSFDQKILLLARWQKTVTDSLLLTLSATMKVIRIKT